MLYLANPSSPKIREHMLAGDLGFINTPRQGNRHIPGTVWCADNSCFGIGYPGDDKYIAWLASHAAHKDDCLFATAPDVVGDAKATLARSRPMLSRIREIGYRAALVGQDGMEHLDVPWDEFDCLFVGGSTEWKLGAGAEILIREAKRRGKWVHIGRVNSRKRYLKFADLADSCDGTYLTFGPDVNLPKLLRWLEDWKRPKLF